MVPLYQTLTGTEFDRAGLNVVFITASITGWLKISASDLLITTFITLPFLSISAEYCTFPFSRLCGQRQGISQLSEYFVMVLDLHF